MIAACGDDDTETATASGGDADQSDMGDGHDDDGHAATTTVTVGDDRAGADGDEAGEIIEVGIEGGQVSGGGRVPVELGSTVTIRVTSDVADHVHLHGYDVMVDVPAGETAELTFDATIPGVFEVELEDSRIPLLELEIS